MKKRILSIVTTAAVAVMSFCSAMYTPVIAIEEEIVSVENVSDISVEVVETETTPTEEETEVEATTEAPINYDELEFNTSTTPPDCHHHHFITTTCYTGLRGDVDQNGILDMNDVYLLDSYIQMRIEWNDLDIEKAVADYDCNDCIDCMDVRGMLKEILDDLPEPAEGENESGIGLEVPGLNIAYPYNDSELAISVSDKSIQATGYIFELIYDKENAPFEIKVPSYYRTNSEFYLELVEQTDNGLMVGVMLYKGVEPDQPWESSDYIFDVEFKNDSKNTQAGVYPIEIKVHWLDDMGDEIESPVGYSGSISVEPIVSEKGDANCDNKINVADIVFVQFYLTSGYNFSEEVKDTIDVNTDSAINVFDLVGIKRMALEQ